MTKEELKKEAKEWIKDHSGLIGSYEFVKYDYDSMQKAYLAGAEPREKRIADLEDKLANADCQLEGRDKEITELEAQIEKMKSCENCNNFMHRIDHRCNTKCKDLSEWEIKEKNE